MVKNYSTYINEAKGDQLFKQGDVAYFVGDHEYTEGPCEIMTAGFNTGTKIWNYKIKLRTNRFWVDEGYLTELDGDRKWNKEPIKPKAAVRWYKSGKFSAPVPSEDVPDFVDFITNDKFRQFLIDNGAYTKYINNVKQLCGRLPNFIEKFSENNQRELINHAFTWDRTPEDQNYWSDLNDKWKNLF